MLLRAVTVVYSINYDLFSVENQFILYVHFYCPLHCPARDSRATPPSTATPLINRHHRCAYQSITQQYLKRYLIKDEVNYIFRPNVAIIRFSSESMVVVLYRIGMGMSRGWDLSICDVCYMIFFRGTGGGGYLWCALSWGVQLKYVCSLLSYVGLLLLFAHIRCLLLVGFCYGSVERRKTKE